MKQELKPPPRMKIVLPFCSVSAKWVPIEVQEEFVVDDNNISLLDMVALQCGGSAVFNVMYG